MAFVGLRTFYYFHNEDKVMTNLLPKIKAYGLDIEYIMGGLSQGNQPLIPKTVRLNTIDNLMLLSLFWPAATLAEAQREIKLFEEQGILNEGFLGKTTLLNFSGDNWPLLLKDQQNYWERTVVFQFDTPALSLARLGWLWAEQEAVYIALCPEQSFDVTSLLDSGLAQIEAAALKLHTISGLYISQSKYISEDKNRLDRALNELLNRHSIQEATSDQLPDILENTLTELSNSYIHLSGYYRVIREAHSRTAALLASLRRRLNRENILAGNRSISSLFLDYYVNRLTSLRDIQKDLQSSLNDHRAAIEMVQGRIDVMNSRENLRLQHRLGAVMELNTSLQEQSLTFQIAASLIEFIILAYYSLSLFKYLAPTAYHHVPGWALLLLFSFFAGGTVMATHVVAEKIMGKHSNNTTAWLVCLLLIITLGTIFYLAISF